MGPTRTSAGSASSCVIRRPIDGGATWSLSKDAEQSEIDRQVEESQVESEFVLPAAAAPPPHIVSAPPTSSTTVCVFLLNLLTHLHSEVILKSSFGPIKVKLCRCSCGCLIESDIDTITTDKLD